jgi:hypothetical protein
MRFACLFLLFAGCSYTFDSEAPSLPLMGVMPNTPALPHLNQMPATSEQLIPDTGGRWWLAMLESDNTWRFVRLTGDSPGAVQTIAPGQYDDVLVTARALYLTKRGLDIGPSDGSAPDGGASDAGAGNSSSSGNGSGSAAMPVRLTVRSIDESPGRTFVLPGGPAILFVGGGDTVFAYLPTSADQPGYILQRRFSSFMRIVPWPKGVDPANPFGKGNFFWDSTGDVFYDRNAEGRIVAHSAHDNTDIDLGIRPPFFNFISRKTLVTCGIDGVRLVPVDGKSPEIIVDDDVCAEGQLFWYTDPSHRDYEHTWIYYLVGKTLRKTNVATHEKTTVFDTSTRRLWSVHLPDDIILYSTDPDDRYAHGAGDGWLGNWRFMERGGSITFPGDMLHLYWIDHSALNAGAGLLSMATLPGRAQPSSNIARLADNVRAYSFLPDGRIVCDENHAFNGTQNRIVVIDTLRHNKQWVASSANHYMGIPGTNDLVVDVVSGATGHDVVRVTPPPIYPPVPPN